MFGRICFGVVFDPLCCSNYGSVKHQLSNECKCTNRKNELSHRRATRAYVLIAAAYGTCNMRFRHFKFILKFVCMGNAIDQISMHRILHSRPNCSPKVPLVFPHSSTLFTFCTLIVYYYLANDALECSCMGVFECVWFQEFYKKILKFNWMQNIIFWFTTPKCFHDSNINI